MQPRGRYAGGLIPGVTLAGMEVVARYKFEAMVADALDDLPDELAHVLDNVVVQVFDRHPDEPGLLGLYEGVPHTERTGHEGPDVVSIYRFALCEMCDDLDDLNEEMNLQLPTERSDTLGGFIYELVGKVPSQGEAVEYQNLKFIIDRVHRQRIIRVRIQRNETAARA